MKILDMFCGAGGASMGYRQAFPDAEITGIDIVDQPDYPFNFIEGDALEADVASYDLVHASPPCQDYSTMSNRWGSQHPKLINQVRDKLFNGDYVIENVVGASKDMYANLMLCGTMFGLPLRRHRLFETSFLIWQPLCNTHTRQLVPVYGKPDGRRLYTYPDGEQIRAWSSVEEGQRALNMWWTDNPHQLREAIPPAYTKYVGEHYAS